MLAAQLPARGHDGRPAISPRAWQATSTDVDFIERFDVDPGNAVKPFTILPFAVNFRRAHRWIWPTYNLSTNVFGGYGRRAALNTGCLV
jgi:hypothetical protein